MINFIATVSVCVCVYFICKLPKMCAVKQPVIYWFMVWQKMTKNEKKNRAHEKKSWFVAKHAKRDRNKIKIHTHTLCYTLCYTLIRSNFEIICRIRVPLGRWNLSKKLGGKKCSFCLETSLKCRRRDGSIFRIFQIFQLIVFAP